jgi:uncharacterized protein (TIGR03435 family)
MQGTKPTRKPKATNQIWRFIAGLTILMSASLYGQMITGTWQGTLPIPENPRIVLEITKSADGSLHGGYKQIDRSADDRPLSSITFQTTQLDFAQVYANIGYRGNLSGDGKFIKGTWTENSHTYPLTFVLTTKETLWKYGGGTVLAPMSATADPAFEVATIKPGQPDSKGSGFNFYTRHFTATNRTVEDLIIFAYSVQPRQISGGPSWIRDIKFDIAGEPDASGMPSEDQYRLMVRKLLADRFQLTSHNIQQTFPVYALTVENSPPKVTPSDPKFNSHGSINFKKDQDGQIQLQFGAFTMKRFADMLMNMIRDRQVIDETGLVGLFDIDLLLPPSVMQANSPSAEDDRANAYIHALQPLGLKLVPKREPLDVVVIDHLDKPSAN